MLKRLPPSIFLLFLWGFAGAGLATAQEPPGFEDVSVGFWSDRAQNSFQVGYWTPVRVVLTSEGKDCQVEIETVDGDGVKTVYREDPAGGASPARIIYARFGRRSGAVVVRARRENGELAAEQEFDLGELARVYESTRESILYLYPQDTETLELDDFQRQSPRPEHEAPLVHYSHGASSLPTRWYGYEGIDRVFITTAQSGVLEDMTAEQRAALELWVRMGGRLTLSVGKRLQDVAKLSSVRALLPGDPDRVVMQNRGVGMENFVVQTTQPLTPYSIALFKEPRGAVVVSEQSLTGEVRPAIFRYGHGTGAVTLVAFDLEKEPFREWESVRVLLGGVLELETARRGSEERASQTLGQLSHIGYEDLSGQVRAILDRFEGPSGGSVVIAFSPIAACIVIYILLIAPGDYFLLRRVFGGRMEWTWVTFPVLVLMACGIVFWASAKWKGDQLAVKQIDLVDYDATASTIRGTSWASIYTPTSDKFNLQLRPDMEFSLKEGGGTATEGNLLSWMGLPGRGLGGLNTKGASLVADSYAIAVDDEEGEVDALPIAVASSKVMQGVWWRTHVESGESNLVRKREYIVGEFTNPFPVELDVAVLYYNDWAYLVQRPILPKQTVSVTLDMDEPRDLVLRLTRRRLHVGTKQSGYSTTPWDPSGRDVTRLIEMITLYETAGGKAYVGLTNRYFNHLDWSEQIEQGRAVFIGRAKVGGASLLRDGQSLDPVERWTFCRAVLPVKEPAAN